MPARKATVQAFEVPPKQGPGQVHVVEDFNVGKVATAKRVRNIGESPLTLAFHRGQLQMGRKGVSDELRYAAGKEYGNLVACLARSGRDSTDMDRIAGGSGACITEAQADAARKLISIDSHMKPGDRKIIRRVCGEGWQPAEAVREAIGTAYERATIPRLCEALDCLIDAMEAAKKTGYSQFRIGG